jgi:pimeloyl-ACP methyl ester carboxylesterase
MEIKNLIFTKMHKMILMIIKAKHIFLIVAIFLFGISNAQVKMNFDFNTPYGSNKTIGKYIKINGTKIYFEEYGKGEPLLLIHGNGGSIKDMGNQIEYFKLKKYRVIIADNRGHGKTDLKTDSLTYVQITKDLEGLVNHLKLDSLNIIGWSDGGIIGLKMGISKKTKIKKIITMGANLRPDSTAVYPWAVKEVNKQKKMAIFKISENDTIKNWNLSKQRYGLLVDQPNIPIVDLLKIKAKVLIIAGDKDIIREEHSVEIYQNIPQAQLSIMPGETHFTPASNPNLFNKIANGFYQNRL